MVPLARYPIRLCHLGSVERQKGPAQLQPTRVGGFTSKNWVSTKKHGELDGILPATKLKSFELKSGWWLTYPSEKYEFVSWDDDIPNIWKVIIQSCSKPPTRSGFFCHHTTGIDREFDWWWRWLMIGLPRVPLVKTALNMGSQSRRRKGMYKWCDQKRLETKYQNFYRKTLELKLRTLFLRQTAIMI